MRFTHEDILRLRREGHHRNVEALAGIDDVKEAWEVFRAAMRRGLPRATREDVAEEPARYISRVLRRFVGDLDKLARSYEAISRLPEEGDDSEVTR